MKYYYRLNPIGENVVPIKGYRQRMYRELFEWGHFGDATEQRTYDQAMALRKKMDG